MQTLSEVLQTCARHDGRLTASVADGWTQGRSVYGGLQAILAVEAMQAFGEGLPLRTLQATLCAPVPAGTVEVRARLLRQGNNTRQVEARIVSGDETLAAFVGIFGRARESAVVLDAQRASDPDRPGTRLPFLKGVLPAFVQHFDVTLLEGHVPGSGRQDTGHRYRLSLKDSTDVAGMPHLLAFADYPPPIGLSWLRGFKPASTMTWMLTFTGQPFDGLPLADWSIDVRLEAARDGYTQQSLTVYAPDGRPLVHGTQCMVVFG